MPCPFSFSLSDDLVDLEEDREASEGGQAAPEGGREVNEVSLLCENVESVSSGRVRKRTEAGRELNDVVQLGSEKAGKRARKRVNYISSLPWGW